MALVIGEVGVVPRIVPQRDPRLAVWVVRVARTAQEADRGEHRWRRRLADRMDDVPLGTLGLSEGDVVRGDPAELETADHIEPGATGGGEECYGADRCGVKGPFSHPAVASLWAGRRTLSSGGSGP